MIQDLGQLVRRSHAVTIMKIPGFLPVAFPDSFQHIPMFLG